MAASRGKRHSTYIGRGTHHVIKCTRPSADENTPTRNYNLRSMHARVEKAWFLVNLTSDFLVVLSQHADGNFVMQRDSHMTAVAHLFRLSSARCTAHTSKKEELLL